MAHNTQVRLTARLEARKAPHLMDIKQIKIGKFAPSSIVGPDERLGHCDMVARGGLRAYTIADTWALRTFSESESMVFAFQAVRIRGKGEIWGR